LSSTSLVWVSPKTSPGGDALTDATHSVHEARLVAAILDRLTFHAHIIETGSDSYRLRTTKAKRTR
jgi:IstB-like ATP binding protein